MNYVNYVILKMLLFSFFDLSKAFYCVSFSGILQKLKFYGLSHSSLHIISSYLSKRIQYVSD